jgi:hypothetical protein
MGVYGTIQPNRDIPKNMDKEEKRAEETTVIF